MNKLDEFKNFVKNNSFLIDKVHNNEVTWQKLYETYDIYGPEHELFKNVYSTSNTSTILSKEGINNAINVIKNVDLEKISSGLENVKKVVATIQGITKPTVSETSVPEYIKKSTFRRYND